MNASSLLVLALAVFGASAAPCLNTVGVLNNVGGFGGCNTCNTCNTVGNLGNLNTVQTIGNFGGLNAFNALNAVNSVNGGTTVALQAPNTYVQTGVVENPTCLVPPILPSVSVSKSCHCIKTFQRPQVRNEFYTVPSVDRLTRVVTTPVVDVATCGGNLVGSTKQLETVLPSCVSNGFVSGNVLANNFLSNGLSGNVLVGVQDNNNCGCAF